MLGGTLNIVKNSYSFLNHAMETTISQIVFYAISAVMLFAAIYSVAAKKMLRAATCLLVVLICTAGLYLLLNYHFLAAVQLSVYAGGILVLFIFAILLTRTSNNDYMAHSMRKMVAGAATAILGAAFACYILLKTKFLYSTPPPVESEVSMAAIGTMLMGTQKYQYLLAFEVLSILLLVCIVGGVIVARKRV
jgi:NADH-quinone oxidoreductase subunit J